jgi:hypothetical protein
MKGVVMKRGIINIGFILGVYATVAMAGPEVSFSGFLDADVWADMTGMYYANSELDLGMSLQFSEKVSANVYTTVLSGNSPSGRGGIPAGDGLPEERWVDVAFDGFDITFTTKAGEFSVGDLVYQYGCFNYYLYKRTSMVTYEGFTRGLKYSVGNDLIKQQIMLGIADKNSSSADVQGVTELSFSETQGIGLYYGLRNDAKCDFKTGSEVFAGLEYTGNFRKVLSLKFDVGYYGYMAEGASERTNMVNILFEPALSLGNFSTAFTAFFSIDGDDTTKHVEEIYGVKDEMFFYLESGYSFTDFFAFGLPLEIHAFAMDNHDDNEFWAVPTFYIYPFDAVEWWIWAQAAKPLSETDPYFGAGLEIIVNF